MGGHERAYILEHGNCGVKDKKVRLRDIKGDI
jgi:hypothetical protein